MLDGNMGWISVRPVLLFASFVYADQSGPSSEGT